MFDGFPVIRKVNEKLIYWSDKYFFTKIQLSSKLLEVVSLKRIKIIEKTCFCHINFSRWDHLRL